MAFILLFVVVSLSIPLSLEVYKNGSNNVIQNSLEDIRYLAKRVGLGTSAAAATATSFVQGAIALLAILVVAGFVLKLLFAVAKFIFDWLFG